MEILTILIPVSLGLGAAGLIAFVWAMRANQFDDPKGDSERILSDKWDEAPRPD